MNYGKKITIYLADGSPTGIRYAELSNWSGQAIVCPRARVGELAQWEESKKPGVYILFGEDTSGTKQSAYVGEAENVFDRLQSHIRNKEFWDRVVLFTSKDTSLTKGHVKYLETRFIQLAGEARRTALENGTAPQLPALPRPDRDAMEEFLEPARILLGALGFPLLQPLVKTGGTSGDKSGKAGPLASVKLYYKLPKSGIDAQGAATDEGFVVFAGSRGAATVQDYLNPGWKDRREELLADGTLVVEGNTLRFTRDALFPSSSTAAAIICGGNRNGREVWRSESGAMLKELEEALVASDDGKVVPAQ